MVQFSTTIFFFIKLEFYTGFSQLNFMPEETLGIAMQKKRNKLLTTHFMHKNRAPKV